MKKFIIELSGFFLLVALFMYFVDMMFARFNGTVYLKWSNDAQVMYSILEGWILIVGVIIFCAIYNINKNND